MLEENQAASALLLWLSGTLGRAQKLLPGPTSPASGGPSILGSTIFRFQSRNRSQLAQLIQIKHAGATMADWLLERRTESRLLQTTGVRSSQLQRKRPCENVSSWPRLGWNTLHRDFWLPLDHTPKMGSCPDAFVSVVPPVWDPLLLQVSAQMPPSSEALPVCPVE